MEYFALAVAALRCAWYNPYGELVMARRMATTVDAETAESIFSEIRALQRKLEILRKKVIKLLPAKYGSDLWWEKEHEEAFEDIKTGRVRKLTSVSELDKPLKELFP